ncbi:hypothetical protein FORC17_3061 [Vibrio vulnificus]|nr:hypothetical protein FORC17_3061 [Vibrio vulnificus]
MFSSACTFLYLSDLTTQSVCTLARPVSWRIEPDQLVTRGDIFKPFIPYYGNQ